MQETVCLKVKDQVHLVFHRKSYRQTWLSTHLRVGGLGRTKFRSRWLGRNRVQLHVQSNLQVSRSQVSFPAIPVVLNMAILRTRTVVVESLLRFVDHVRAQEQHQITVQLTHYP